MADEVAIAIGVLFGILILLVLIIITCFKVLAERREREGPAVQYVRVPNQEPQVAIVPNPNPSREMRDIRDFRLKFKEPYTADPMQEMQMYTSCYSLVDLDEARRNNQ